MKTKSIIIITVCVYAAAMVYTLGWGVDSQIQKRIDSEFDYISEQLNDFFYTKQHRFYDVIYSNRDVKYEKVNIPKKPQPTEFHYKDDLEEWKERFGDIQELYSLKYMKDAESNAKNGWCLGLIEYRGENTIRITTIFPYAVGYFEKQYYYRPSVKDAVESAYDYWVNDKNSSYAEDFKKGSIDDCFDKMYEISAELKYFRFNDQSQPTHIVYFREVTLFNQPLEHTDLKYSNDKEDYDKYEQQPLDGSYYWNGYHKVYNAFTRPRSFSFIKKQHTIDSDIVSLRIKWAIGLTVALLAIIIPLIVINKKRRKIESENLYDKLKRLCNPSNFLKNYDKDKVDVANEIYQKLLQTNPGNTETLNEVQKNAVEKLKISLIDTSLLNALKKKVNPKNFMKNYDAEKVTLANDLYSRLSKEDLTYNEFVEIQELAKKL